MNTEYFTITEKGPQRLDQILSSKYKERSRSYIHYLFSKEAILKNNSPCKKNVKVTTGDIIHIEFLPLAEVKLKAENISLDILYEDSYLIICNKPTKMVTHPAPGSLDNTFAGALLFYLKSLPQSDDPLRPGIVHRLDKDTSGVIIAAKTPEALIALQKLFSKRDIKKEYLAICHNVLHSEVIDQK